MHRNRNLILTWASGENFCGLKSFKVFLKSLQNIDAQKVVITHDIPNEIAAEIEDQDFKVMIVPKESISYVPRDRFLAYWNYLLDYGHKYQYVLAVDSKDVIFQRDPFSWIEVWKSRFDSIPGKHAFLDHFVILVSEGMKMKQSGWNMVEQFEFQADVKPAFRVDTRENWVLNSGVCMGTPDAMKNYFFVLWSNHMKTIGRCTDQACLNYLHHYLQEDETYSVTQPWNDTFCLTGEAVKNGHVEVIFENGKFYSKSNDLYYLVHQWDRTEYAKEIERHYEQS